MKNPRLRSTWPAVLVAALLSACATPPPAPEPPPPPTKAPEEPPPVVITQPVKVNEAAMLPLLGYLQLLQQMSPHQLVRERTMLAALPQTPATQVRMAMLLGLPRGPMDLGKASALLESVLKSGAPAATSLHPLARALAGQYQERLKLDAQNEKLTQQLKDSQRRNAELQEKLDAMADIENSIPLRPTPGKNPPGSPR